MSADEDDIERLNREYEQDAKSGRCISYRVFYPQMSQVEPQSLHLDVLHNLPIEVDRIRGWLEDRFRHVDDVRDKSLSLKMDVLHGLKIIPAARMRESFSCFM